jgi:PLP dependent protein
VRPLYGYSVGVIADNIARVSERVRNAARRAGRSPREITLMAVTKTIEPARIREAYAAGIRVFGENRVQEFEGKRGDLADLRDAEFHLIGHLQSNKAAKAAELFSTIDSLDSLALAQKLNSAAAKLGRMLPVLVEINVGGEEGKSGFAPDPHELDELLLIAESLANIEIRGLMAVPPYTADPEGARPYFRKIRELRDRIAARALRRVSIDVLSMGMSHDFEVAIEEGSTCVRVGTAIFGERPK